MFIRKTTKLDRKSNKNYYQFQLIESVRTSRGPRQQILLNLGVDLDLSDEDRKQLADCIENKVRNIQTLFPYPPYIEKLAHRFARQLIQRSSTSPLQASGSTQANKESDFHSVDIDSLEYENIRTVGLEHVCLKTIKKLELDTLLIKLGFSTRQVEVAIGVIIAKLAGRCSDKSTFEWLRDTSAIGELLGEGFDRLSPNSVYQIADRLLEKKNEIEEFLYAQEKQLFSLDNTIVFYDLTNTYFEGSAKLVSMAAKGRSKDKRTDCPLVTLGLRMDRAGFPMKSEVLPGNVSEPKTLQAAISQLDSGEDKKPTIVLDAGLATDENITWLQEEQYSYIVCSRKRNQEPPSNLPFETVCEKNGNTVKAGTVYDSITGETLVYCHSKFKEDSEVKWMQSARSRFEEALKKLENGLNRKGHTKGLAAVHAKIGSIRKQYSRIAQFYTIETSTDSSGKVVVAIKWSFDEKRASSRLAGNYCLRTFRLDAKAQELWAIYIMLTQVEEAFRCLKSELGLRPIYHQVDRRLEAHLFITVLAYHVLQSIQIQLSSKAIHFRWETIRRGLQTHVRVTTSMRTNQNKTIHARNASNPDPFQKGLYNALGIEQRPGSRIKTIL